MHLLEVSHLNTQFRTSRGTVMAASDVNFQIEAGEIVAIVGESGSGKSVTAQSILQLISPPGKIVGGEILLEGDDLLKKDRKQMCAVRGKDISMIFQEPMTSLNPAFTCGSQVVEVLLLHQKMTKKEARAEAANLFRMVGIPDPERRLDEYPHQLSGGMRQRVMIAIALACRPKLLIADEPTTALDVTIQAQILDLLKTLQAETGMSILLITHDFGVVSEMADRVIVMYAGKTLEMGKIRDIMDRPLHPYTQGLLQAIPLLQGGGKRAGERLYSIDGMVPNLAKLPAGCSFSPRCTKCCEKCHQEMPPTFKLADGRTVRCWLYEKEGEPE